MTLYVVCLPSKSLNLEVVLGTPNQTLGHRGHLSCFLEVEFLVGQVPKAEPEKLAFWAPPQ